MKPIDNKSLVLTNDEAEKYSSKHAINQITKLKGIYSLIDIPIKKYGKLFY
jgi:hypothetical protein